MTMEETIRTIVRDEIRAAVAELKAALVEAQPASSPADLLTVDEVAKRAGNVSAETVRGWIHTERLVARRAGHRWVVRPDDLERFLANDGANRETITDDEHLRLVMGRMGGAR